VILHRSLVGFGIEWKVGVVGTEQGTVEGDSASQQFRDICDTGLCKCTCFDCLPQLAGQDEEVQENRAARLQFRAVRPHFKTQVPAVHTRDDTEQ